MKTTDCLKKNYRNIKVKPYVYNLLRHPICFSYNPKIVLLSVFIKVVKPDKKRDQIAIS